MATHYTDLIYLGHAFRIFIYDYVEHYGLKEEGFMVIPGHWHLDVEIDPKTPRKVGQKLYEDVYTAVVTRREAVTEVIDEGIYTHQAAVVNPHFNDLGAAKRQVRAAIEKLSQLHPKRWGIIAWNERWLKA